MEMDSEHQQPQQPLKAETEEQSEFVKWLRDEIKNVTFKTDKIILTIAEVILYKRDRGRSRDKLLVVVEGSISAGISLGMIEIPPDENEDEIIQSIAEKICDHLFGSVTDANVEQLSGSAAVISRPRKDLLGAYLPKNGELPVDRLCAELDAIVQEHKPKTAGRGSGVIVHNSDVAAPFLFVLQSTGYGKTRAILELARKKRLVYLLLKDLPDSWTKPSVVSSVLNQMGGYDDERTWYKFLTAVKECAELEQFNTTKKLREAQITDTGEFGAFFEALDTLWKEINTPAAATATVTSCLKPHSARNNSEPETKKTRFSSDITDTSLVVCFDEVSALSDIALQALRRAAKDAGVLSIFSDSAASICKVMKSNDHSSMVKRGHLGRFVPPVFALCTTDLTWKVTGHDEEYETLFCAGRPLWRSHMTMCKENEETGRESIESLIRLATDLLVLPADHCFGADDRAMLRVTRSDSEGLDEIHPGQIALFTCRFALGPLSKLSSMLARHSLATVIGVSEVRNIIYSEYPSEPVLAEASARHTKDETKLRVVLQHVKVAFHPENKMLDPPGGDVGEMCAAALLGYAMDHNRKAQQHQYMSQTVPLRDLLRLLLKDPSVIETDKTIKDIVEDWGVNFTHFVRTGWEPDQNDLKPMWMRRKAVYVPIDGKGLDLLIVIRHKTEDNNYGTLRVQVKNYKGKISRCIYKDSFAKLLPSKCPPKVVNESFSVGLLLSVNPISQRCQLLSGPCHTPWEQGTKMPLENPVLQLATCFPSARDSPLLEVSKHLKDICSQNTAEAIEIDRFFEY